MGQSAEELRRDIERTRSDLSGTLDAIGDRVSPGRMVDRRKNRMVLGMRSMKERVMGSASDTTTRMGDKAHQVSDSAHHAPDALKEKTEGAPMIAGALAFGVGFLVASALPATEQEQEIAEPILDKIEPIKHEVSSAAHDVAEHMKEPAKQAAANVRDSATESAHEVSSSASHAVSDVEQRAGSKR